MKWFYHNLIVKTVIASRAQFLQQSFYKKGRLYSKIMNESDVVESIQKTKKRRANGITIGTHSGTFHCDEVLACFMLKQLPKYENAKIFRSRNEKDLKEKCDIIVDVGGVFNHEEKLYDHHQKNFQGTLSSLKPEYGTEFNIRLSSAGLIYTYYGEEIIDKILQKHRNLSLTKENLKSVFIAIYKNFIREIDAIDNGVPMFDSEPLYRICTGINDRIGKMNPPWDETNFDRDECFKKAMDTIGIEFTERVIAMGTSWINARDLVREALEGAKEVYETGEILMLKKFCPWKVHLSELEKEYGVVGIPKYVITSENENSWRVAGVPLTPESYLGRKFFPESWRGLDNKKLSEIAGVPSLIFCHHTGFIAGTKTRESALQMAIRSLHFEQS